MHRVSPSVQKKFICGLFKRATKAKETSGDTSGDELKLNPPLFQKEHKKKWDDMYKGGKRKDVVTIEDCNVVKTKIQLADSKNTRVSGVSLLDSTHIYSILDNIEKPNVTYCVCNCDTFKELPDSNGQLCNQIILDNETIVFSGQSNNYGKKIMPFRIGCQIILEGILIDINGNEKQVSSESWIIGPSTGETLIKDSKPAVAIDVKKRKRMSCGKYIFLSCNGELHGVTCILSKYNNKEIVCTPLNKYFGIGIGIRDTGKKKNQLNLSITHIQPTLMQFRCDNNNIKELNIIVFYETQEWISEQETKTIKTMKSFKIYEKTQVHSIGISSQRNLMIDNIGNANNANNDYSNNGLNIQLWSNLHPLPPLPMVNGDIANMHNPHIEPPRSQSYTDTMVTQKSTTHRLPIVPSLTCVPSLNENEIRNCRSNGVLISNMNSMNNNNNFSNSLNNGNIGGDMISQSQIGSIHDITDTNYVFGVNGMNAGIEMNLNITPTFDKINDVTDISHSGGHGSEVMHNPTQQSRSHSYSNVSLGSSVSLTPPICTATTTNMTQFDIHHLNVNNMSEIPENWVNIHCIFTVDNRFD